MTNWVPLSALRRWVSVPETDLSPLLLQEYGILALDLLNVSGYYDRKVCLGALVNHKFDFPQDLLYVEGVAYLKNEDESVIRELQKYVVESRSFEGDYLVETTSTYTPFYDTDSPNANFIKSIQYHGVLNDYKVFLDSELFKVNFEFLNYRKGPFLAYCENLPHVVCDNWFKTNPYRQVESNIESGTIAVSYLTRPTNSSGEILIPDDQNLMQALASFVKMRYWEDRSFTKEEQAFRLYKQYQEEWSFLSIREKGASHKFNFDPQYVFNMMRQQLSQVRHSRVFDGRAIRTRRW